MNKSDKNNILFIMTDQMRYPPIYENEDIKKWRKKNLTAQNQLKKEGFEFVRHYTGTVACTPSRATIFTGQYPSLHGVANTDGIAKSAFDPDMFWLDPNTVPDMGAYFKAAGYRTFYKGKWHISAADILIPGTKTPYTSYNSDTGVPDKDATAIYENANRLDVFGWDKWIGPEPHGSSPRDSGNSASTGVSGRDEIYVDEVITLLKYLNKNKNKNHNNDHNDPWILVASLVNPHDISLYGEITKLNQSFSFDIDKSVPDIPKSPTANEDLSTKPKCQQDYKLKYQLALQPTIDSEEYRRFYYSLNLTADQNMQKILDTLEKTHFDDNTIVIFTSDHGDYIGAHGLFQKWYTAYEESIHVPLIIKLPKNKNKNKKQYTKMLTSSVDLLPTMLGLANIDVNKVQQKLTKTHTEVHNFVGRDLSSIIYGKHISGEDEPILFVSDDDAFKGLNQNTFTGKPYNPIVQPNHIETTITELNNSIYKYSRYYDNPLYWSNPYVEDVTTIVDPITGKTTTVTKTVPVDDEYEMYNLSNDPYEEKNLAHSKYATSDSDAIQKVLKKILKKQVEKKLLLPSSGLKPGMIGYIPIDRNRPPKPS